MDDNTNLIAERLRELYAPGLCKLHPDKACYFYVKGNLHFDLDRTKLIIWAVKIVSYLNALPLQDSDELPQRSGLATYEVPPVASIAFSAAKAIRMRSDTSAPVAPASSKPVGSNHIAAPQFPGYAYPSTVPPGPLYYPGMIAPPAPMYPPWYPPPPPTASAHYTPPLPPQGSSSLALVGQSLDHIRLSPPPFDSECPSLEEWCARFGISDAVRRGLENLGFEPGNDLSSLTNVDWDNAGLGLLLTIVLRIVIVYSGVS
jgi:hypothetical protein